MYSMLEKSSAGKFTIGNCKILQSYLRIIPIFHCSWPSLRKILGSKYLNVLCIIVLLFPLRLSLNFFVCLFLLIFFFIVTVTTLLIQAGDFKEEFPGEIPACRLRNEVREVIYFKQVVQTLRLQHGLKWKTKQNRFLSSKYIFVKSAVMHSVEARVPNIEEIVTWQ